MGMDPSTSVFDASLECNAESRMNKGSEMWNSIEIHSCSDSCICFTQYPNSDDCTLTASSNVKMSCSNYHHKHSDCYVQRSNLVFFLDRAFFR